MKEDVDGHQRGRGGQHAEQRRCDAQGTSWSTVWSCHEQEGQPPWETVLEEEVGPRQRKVRSTGMNKSLRVFQM